MAGTHASFPIFFGLSFFRAFVIARFPCFSVSFPLFPFSQFSLSYTRLDSGVLPELPSRKTLVLPIFKLDFSEEPMQATNRAGGQFIRNRLSFRW